MTGFNKKITIILILYIIGWSIYRKITLDNFAILFHLILISIVCIPLILSEIFFKSFKQTQRPNKLQWIPDLLLFFILLVSVITLFVGLFTKNEGFEQLKIQKKDRKEVARAITNWIKKNASSPQTYKPIDLTYIFSNGSEYTDTNKLEDFKLETKTKQGYFFVRHVFQIMNNHNIIKVDTVYFQLLPNYQVTNVRTKNETKKFIFETAEYEWRQQYGNSKRNLELEIFGNNSESYIYHQYTREGGRQTTAIYSNGKLNGNVYVYDFYNDTLIIAEYKDGIAKSINVKREPNNSTSPELYDTREYFTELSKQIMKSIKK